MATESQAAAYLPVLDGLRGVSILLVVLSHLGLERIVPGAFGVTLFFFISGFLITRQLTRQRRADLRGFYLRRVLRLAPVSTVYIVVAGLAYLAAGGTITPAGWAAALGHGANYYDLWAHYGPTLPGVRHPFNILWSLAIEEHFYLVWPLVLAVLRSRYRFAACLVVCVFVPLWRLWLLHACFSLGAPSVCGPANPDPIWRFNRLYLATDTRVDSIAWGALLAVWPSAKAAGRPVDVLSGVFLLALSFALPGPLGRHVLRPSLQGLALLSLIPWLLNTSSLTRRALCSGPATGLGRRSYSLYLWHWGALATADFAAGGNRVAWVGIALPLSAGLAGLSYHAIERPMLRLRRWAGSHAPLSGAAARGETEEPDAADRARHTVSAGRRLLPPGSHHLGR